MNWRSGTAALLVSTCLILTGTRAQAFNLDDTWTLTNASSWGFYNSTLNWANGQVPTSTNPSFTTTAIFPAGGATIFLGSGAGTIATAFQLQSGANYTFVIDTGQTLSLNAGTSATSASPTFYVNSGGILNIPNPLDAFGSINLAGSSLQTAGGNININGGVNLAGASFQSTDGNININGSVNLAGTTVQNAGGNISINAAGASLSTATFLASGGTTTLSNATSGIAQATVSGGNLTINGNSVINGTPFSVTAGGVLAFGDQAAISNASLTANSGTILVGDSATMQLASASFTNSTLGTQNNGSLTIQGATAATWTLSNATFAAINGGTTTLNNLTVGGWQGAANGGNLFIGGNSVVNGTQFAVTNNGNLTFNGNSVVNGTQFAVTNGTLTFTDSTVLQSGSNGASTINVGTNGNVQFSGAASASNLNIVVSGAGTIGANGTGSLSITSLALGSGMANLFSSGPQSIGTVTMNNGFFSYATNNTQIGVISGNGMVNNFCNVPSACFPNPNTVLEDIAPDLLLVGNVTVNGNLTTPGTVAPGNSIGTITVNGNFTGGRNHVYLAEINPSGINDRIVVNGVAKLQGGTVVVIPEPGLYAPRKRYTVLTATGGITGTHAGITSVSPFLVPRLIYGANQLDVEVQIGGFANVAQTPIQLAVGSALDSSAATATGDYATVLGTLAGLTPAQVQPILTALSGTNYSGFSSSMVQGAQFFMNNFASQSGGSSSPGNRLALAEACDIACDTTMSPRWGAWGGATGGLGTIGAGTPQGAVTYNAGGFAAGLDRTFSDSFRAGVAVGYSAGTQWVSGFSGQGNTSTVQFGLYGNYADGPVYADALVGYAYSANQMTRQILVPGLPSRTAWGQTGANQFFGQVEAGYRVDIGTRADASVTPFARLQAYTGTQNGFTESGAQSLDLSVSQQTTNSLRSVIGAQLGASIDMGWREKLALQFRLGWSHEYADVGRPVTAALAGAPATPFTTYGVSPTRDGVLLGFGANTAVAEATSLYLRYEGTLAGQDGSHALTAGVRIRW